MGPEQRMLSSFAYNQTNNMSSLKSSLSGLATKMLTRGGCVYESRLPPSRDEVEKAKSRLRTGVAFVGITEKWNLSMCLFNKMFNQKCRFFQFANAHPTHGNRMTVYDTSALDGF